jgi:hypothetical protein
MDHNIFFLDIVMEVTEVTEAITQTFKPVFPSQK